MYCLGIESSCDETGLAVVCDGRLVGQVLASQVDMHALFGGVVPELASREHARAIGPLFDELMARTGLQPQQIDTIAVSRGPGLLGSLLVGVAFAKALALGTGARIIGINHLHAHLLSVGLTEPLHYPTLGLLVSGGHTNIYRIDSPIDFHELGRTIDDACGEAFDKVGNLLGMRYPSGRFVDCAARLGTKTIDFPIPYMDNDTLDFSFSGLKTAVAQEIAKRYPTIPWERPVERVDNLPRDVFDLCASFSYALAETLVRKLERAFVRNPAIHTCLLAGGVAANSLIREKIASLCARHDAELLVPEAHLCTDNGAMVAYAGWLLSSMGYSHSIDFETIPRGRTIPVDFQWNKQYDQRCGQQS